MKDSREEPKLIDEINLSTDELLYEDCTGRINFPNGIGECSIYVYSNEGTIPHFHIIKGKFECCVCIYEALYFNHGSKQGKLNSKQRKILDKWLDSPNKYLHNTTNWEAISFAWIIGNGDNYVPIKEADRKKPNYLNMENMRN